MIFICFPRSRMFLNPNAIWKPNTRRPKHHIPFKNLCGMPNKLNSRVVSPSWCSHNRVSWVKNNSILFQWIKSPVVPGMRCILNYTSYQTKILSFRLARPHHRIPSRVWRTKLNWRNYPTNLWEMWLVLNKLPSHTNTWGRTTTNSTDNNRTTWELRTRRRTWKTRIPLFISHNLLRRA